MFHKKVVLWRTQNKWRDLGVGQKRAQCDLTTWSVEEKKLPFLRLLQRRKTHIYWHPFYVWIIPLSSTFSFIPIDKETFFVTKILCQSHDGFRSLFCERSLYTLPYKFLHRSKIRLSLHLVWEGRMKKITFLNRRKEIVSREVEGDFKV